MSNPVAFTIPAGLKLEVAGGTLNLAYDGDILIEQDLGLPLGRVRAGGNLSIRTERVAGDLECGGELRITGEIDAARLHGRTVVLGRQRVKCVSITASESITIGAGDLRVDAIVAPEIRIDPKAGGRVTVIESRNERDATKIKGGFSLADYDDMFGNAREFLAERGVSLLPAAPAPARTTPPLEQGLGAISAGPSRGPASPPRPAPPRPEIAPDAVEDIDDEATVGGRDDDEDTDDPLSLSLDDLEPLMEQALQAQAAPEDTTHQSLSEALSRVIHAYDSGDLPPAVEELRLLIEQRDYPALRQNITEIWNGLLGFHQKRGIRPHPQVTHAFNVIHGLLQ